MVRTPVKILFNAILGIFIFLIIIGFANLLKTYIKNPNFLSVTLFLNRNALFIILILIVMLLGELFKTFSFPLKVFYPLFNATSGVLWVEFIFRLFGIVDILLVKNIKAIFEPFYYITIVLVFLIVIITGYIHVFSSIKPRLRIKKKAKKKNKISTVFSC